MELRPKVIVWGLPPEAEEKEIEIFYEHAARAFESVGELNIAKDSPIFFFPSDRMVRDLGREVCISVVGLNAPEDTGLAREGLRQALILVVRVYFPDVEYVDCTFLPEGEASFWPF